MSRKIWKDVEKKNKILHAIANYKDYISIISDYLQESVLKWIERQDFSFTVETQSSTVPVSIGKYVIEGFAIRYFLTNFSQSNFLSVNVHTIYMP